VEPPGSCGFTSALCSIASGEPVDRSDEFRKAAANCVALARTTSDPIARSNLLTMAQRWYEMATRIPEDFNAVVQDSNDQRMSKPAMQQQQQIQPKKEEDLSRRPPSDGQD
jgi:hypothetical protein